MMLLFTFSLTCAVSHSERQPPSPAVLKRSNFLIIPSFNFHLRAETFVANTPVAPPDVIVNELLCLWRMSSMKPVIFVAG